MHTARTCPILPSATSNSTKRLAKRRPNTLRRPRNSFTRQEPHRAVVLSALVAHDTQSLAKTCTDSLSQILASLIAATTLSLAPNSLPSLVRFGISPAALVLTLFVRAHVSNFWKAKAKIPFVEGYVSYAPSQCPMDEDADKFIERGHLKDRRASASPRMARVHLGWNRACQWAYWLLRQRSWAMVWSGYIVTIRSSWRLVGSASIAYPQYDPSVYSSLSTKQLNKTLR